MRNLQISGNQTTNFNLTNESKKSQVNLENISNVGGHPSSGFQIYDAAIIIKIL